MVMILIKIMPIVLSIKRVSTSLSTGVRRKMVTLLQKDYYDYDEEESNVSVLQDSIYLSTRNTKRELK